MNFSEKVRDARARLGLNQKDLANKSGISIRMIAAYEKGSSFPQAARLYKLAEALEVPAEYLRDDNLQLKAPQYEKRNAPHYANDDASVSGIDLEKMLADNRALFAGGAIDDEAKDMYFQALMRAYLECKDAAKLRDALNHSNNRY
ncbi:MAG: helix-turn-helix transcriptional regulator [Eubacteriaceae bacterium]|nr:helix-turn-helix transcriptional regulator [Eubacteriaceae bacterium]